MIIIIIISCSSSSSSSSSSIQKKGLEQKICMAVLMSLLHRAFILVEHHRKTLKITFYWQHIFKR